MWDCKGARKWVTDTGTMQLNPGITDFIKGIHNSAAMRITEIKDKESWQQSIQISEGFVISEMIVFSTTRKIQSGVSKSPTIIT